jgi:hypothetical protein
MREIRSSGSVEGVMSNRDSYSDFLLVCLRYMLARRVCRRDPLPRRLDRICGRGPRLAMGQESAPRRGAQRILERRACVRRAGVL